MCLQPFNNSSHSRPEEILWTRPRRQRQPSTERGQAPRLSRKTKGSQMKFLLKRIAIPLLQWVVGLVVLLESYRTFRWGLASLHSSHTHGIHPVILLALAGPEIIAAILFLIPRTLILGSYALLIIFALAILVHLLHGQFNFEILLIYAAA